MTPPNGSIDPRANPLARGPGQSPVVLDAARQLLDRISERAISVVAS